MRLRPPAFTENEPYIFMSYKHAKADRVYPIIACPQRRGMRVWYDMGIPAGSNWDKQLHQHIESCACVICFLSTAFLASKNCQGEMFDAKEVDWGPVIVYIENISLPGAMRFRYGQFPAYAKRINLRYAYLYEGVEETEANKESQWLVLDTFTRYCNIRAPDYHDVRRQMMGNAPLTDQTLERLAELKHIRWCRHHFPNNWQWSQPENGKAKDSAKRLHRCLVPYCRLEEQDEEKDRENIRILLALNKQ